MAGELVVSTINGAGFDGGNVVINPEFTINQRGAASRTTTSSAYNFDRWYYDGTNLLQGIEGNNLRAGTYVISWEGSSTAAFSLNTAAASGQGSESYTSVTNGGTITIASVGSNNLWIRFTSDLTNLTKVKVSPGTEASGFVARPYGTELALCQRYFEKCFSQTIAPQQGVGPSNQVYAGGLTAYSTSNARTPRIRFAVTKRASPTITLYRPASAQGGSSDGVWSYYNGSQVWTSFTSNGVIDSSTLDNEFGVEGGISGGFTINNAYIFGGTWTASSEL